MRFRMMYNNYRINMQVALFKITMRNNNKNLIPLFKQSMIKQGLKFIKKLNNFKLNNNYLKNSKFDTNHIRRYKLYILEEFKSFDKCVKY